MDSKIESQRLAHLKGYSAFLLAKRSILQLKEPLQELLELKEVLEEAAANDLMG